MAELLAYAGLKSELIRASRSPGERPNPNIREVDEDFALDETAGSIIEEGLRTAAPGGRRMRRSRGGVLGLAGLWLLFRGGPDQLALTCVAASSRVKPSSLCSVAGTGPEFSNSMQH